MENAQMYENSHLISQLLCVQMMLGTKSILVHMCNSAVNFVV